ncbi:14926_t:CDS:2 [Funneliformis geosporum]|uniref:tRNA (guanine-N(1)-)-methyltransferase n=1 Tax=Funneliformis geosporum TaxID=1117311 RepID=A0A9W4X454_9GLOM|nr:14926_t:CDS:2 [Funneliformis geosporum]
MVGDKREYVTKTELFQELKEIKNDIKEVKEAVITPNQNKKEIKITDLEVQENKLVARLSDGRESSWKIESYHFYFRVGEPLKENEPAHIHVRGAKHGKIQFWLERTGQVDDYPYGGGAGMVLKIEPLVKALATIQEDYPNSYLILLSPQGKTFTQKEQISIGDFITMGGEIPALALTDSLIRAIPGAIQPESYQQETTNSRLDFATYTRPENFEGLEVPPILLSGHHQKIKE